MLTIARGDVTLGNGGVAVEICLQSTTCSNTSSSAGLIKDPHARGSGRIRHRSRCRRPLRVNPGISQVSSTIAVVGDLITVLSRPVPQPSEVIAHVGEHVASVRDAVTSIRGRVPDVRLAVSTNGQSVATISSDVAVGCHAVSFIGEALTLLSRVIPPDRPRLHTIVADRARKLAVNHRCLCPEQVENVHGESAIWRRYLQIGPIAWRRR